MSRVVKRSFPGFIEPMLATLTGRPFSGEEWIFEKKFDGYRVIAAKDLSAALYSRNGNDFSKRYPQISQELSTVNARFVTDGEVCYVEPNGRFDFQKLQDVSHNQKNLHYYVFDLLWLNDRDLMRLPLVERKKLLKILLGEESDHVHYVGHVEKEGVIAKRTGSFYHPGLRRDEWLKVKKSVRWLKPALVCEVKFSAWTRDRIMRHSSFVGLRSDKVPEEIAMEKQEYPRKRLNGSKVRVTNMDKVFWPEEGFTKGDVIRYYGDISGVILPYLEERPQSLYRTPGGIGDTGFFQKNAADIAPEWAETVSVQSSSSGSIEYLLCQDRDTLLYMANLGCIEINPWGSSLPELDKPDFMIFDLDPLEVAFSRVVELALQFRDLFDKLEIPAYCKTSGSRGMHLYIPLQRKYSYQTIQDFVRLIERHIHKRNKEITSLERPPSKRKGMIYLDYLQNAWGKTMSSVYSLRPRPGAPVSAPLEWEELGPDLDPLKFNLRNMRERMGKKGDLWKGIFDSRVDLDELVNRL